MTVKNKAREYIVPNGSNLSARHSISALKVHYSEWAL